jgi:hypothetical protein
MAGKRRFNPRRAKVHRSYTVEEVARLYGVHKQTVRNWLKTGLSALAQRRPHLILGGELREFLARRRDQAKQPCRHGEMYCLRCRSPKCPAADMLDYIPVTLVSGNLRGICPTCEALMHRRVSLAKVNVVRGKCNVAYPQSQQPLTDTSHPSLDCHLAMAATDHEETQ